MKIRQLLISFLLAASTLGATAQVSKTYYVSKPGTLISMMTEEEANSITHLTLTGKLNAERGILTGSFKPIKERIRFNYGLSQKMKQPVLFSTG